MTSKEIRRERKNDDEDFDDIARGRGAAVAAVAAATDHMQSATFE